MKRNQNKGNKKEHDAKSIILYRKKAEDNLSCFISLFDINNPHLMNKYPDKVLEFDGVKRVTIKNLNVDYLLTGNDLVINNLEQVKITKRDNCLNLSGKQRKS